MNYIRPLLGIALFASTASIFSMEKNSEFIERKIVQQFIKCSICKKHTNVTNKKPRIILHSECMKKLQQCDAIKNRPLPKTGKPWEAQ